MLTLGAKVGIGVIATLAVLLGLATWRYTAALSREAATKAALSEALTANASLVDDRKRAIAEAERNRQISATAIREARALDEKIGRLKERVQRGDACLINSDDARALDELFQ